MGEHNCYNSDAQECIQKKAYELWEKDGCKPGCEQDYWLIAEKSVQTPVKTKKSKKRTQVSEA